ncbi:hypothetical protein D3C76_907660 [compost metagenome]|uniref:hypothetical protein n=1 Tax=unclassified Pseudomonas TaxID=196821 RepID=UPI000BB3BD9C|nr:hypothetical protein [Pseudomonas sp. ACN8]PBJ20177.1 hypothetical protein BSF44_42220 [Pseudomonas sp. ACN8]
MTASTFSFSATLHISGYPVRVLENGSIGTQWNGGEPTLFYFNFVGSYCSIYVAGEQAACVSCDERGYLVLRAQPTIFHLQDTETGSMEWSGVAAGSALINLSTVYGGPVLQFGGDDAFNDRDTLYNFLIAAQKVKVETIRDTVKYIVPSGEDSWKSISEKQSYSPKPVSIGLSIKNIGVPGS